MNNAVNTNVYENILEQLNEGIYYVDLNRKITYWNKAAEKITGYTKDDVSGRSCADNLLRHLDENGSEMCQNHCPLTGAIENKKSSEKNIFLHHKDGHRVKVYTRITPIMNSENEVVGAVEFFTDLTRQDQNELITELEKLKKEVYKDALTQVGNRKYAEMTLERRLREWEDTQIPFSVYFIDLDDFKSVNDNYGHNSGDNVLKMVGKSLTTLLRSLDVVCRWGGEEFVIISPNLSRDALRMIGERILKFIEKSWVTTDCGRNIYCTASIGGTTVQDGDTVKSIIKRADSAMYESKINGKNRITIY